MLRYIRRNLVAFVALLVAIALSGGTVAYAANTVRSSDIVDGQVERQDLAANAVATGKVEDGSLRGVDLKDNSVGGRQINESTLGQVPNALTLNGVPVDDLRHYTYTFRDRTDQCVTIGIWSQCGRVTLTVPAGHSYALTVWSSVTVDGAVAQYIWYCPALTGPTCIDGQEIFTLPMNQVTSASTSASTVLSAGTYNISTALHVLSPIGGDADAHTSTTIEVFDTSVLRPPS